MPNIDKLLQNNRQWAEKVEKNQPGFFTRLLNQQHPKYMWIGCSDSRVPANEIVALAPGEVFVHRNVANVMVHSDLNALSTLQFAVELLKVEEILIVGHYGCAGVSAALRSARIGLADNWIRHIQDVRNTHKALIQSVGEKLKPFVLCDLNAIEQARNVAQSTVVQDAWANGQVLFVHALVYALSDGVLHKLGFSVSSPHELDTQYDCAIDNIRKKYDKKQNAYQK